MWTNRVLMCGIDILLCLWAVYLFFFYFDIFFARKRKRYLSVIGITLFVIWQFGITTIISFPPHIIKCFFIENSRFFNLSYLSE